MALEHNKTKELSVGKSLGITANDHQETYFSFGPSLKG